MEKVYGYLSIVRKNGTKGAAFPVTVENLLVGRSAECHIRIHLPDVIDKHACFIFSSEESSATLVNFAKNDSVKVNGTAVRDRTSLKTGDVIHVSERFFIFDFPCSNKVQLSSTPAKPKTPVKKISTPTSASKRAASPAPIQSSPSSKKLTSSPSRRMPQSSPQGRKSIAKRATPVKSKLSQFVVSAADTEVTESPTAAEPQPVAACSEVVESVLLVNEETTEHEEKVDKAQNVALKLDETVFVNTPVAPQQISTPTASPRKIVNEVRSPRAIAVKEDGSRACTPVPCEANAPSVEVLLFSPKKTPSSSAKKPPPIVKTPDILSPRKNRRMSSRIGLDDCSPLATGSPRRKTIGRVAENIVDDIMANAMLANLTEFENTCKLPEETPVEIALFSPRQSKSVTRTPKNEDLSDSAQKKKSSSGSTVAKKLKMIAAESTGKSTPKKQETPKPVLEVGEVHPGLSTALATEMPNPETPNKKTVKFGPALSPEIFDKNRPPNNPVRRGTPVKANATPKRAPGTAFKTIPKKSSPAARSVPCKPVRKMENITIRPLRLPKLVSPKKPVVAVVEASEKTARKSISNYIGVKEMLNTPIPCKDMEGLDGVKNMMNTPKPVSIVQNLDGLEDVKIMLKTPKAIFANQSTDCFEGVAEMMKTPIASKSEESKPEMKKDSVDTIVASVIAEVDTPMEVSSQEIMGLDGLKVLMNTPKESEVAGLDGIKVMMKTPKPNEILGLDGLEVMMKTPSIRAESKEITVTDAKPIWKTPKIQQREDSNEQGMSAIKTLVKTPALDIEANFVGVRAMLKTPKVETNNQDNFEGVENMFKTPAISSEIIGPKTPLKSDRLLRNIDADYSHAIHNLSSHADIETNPLPNSPLDSNPQSPLALEQTHNVVTADSNEMEMQDEIAAKVPEEAISPEKAKKRSTRAKPTATASSKVSKRGQKAKIEETKPVEEEQVIEKPKRGRRVKTIDIVEEPQQEMKTRRGRPAKTQEAPVQEEKPKPKGRKAKSAPVEEEEKPVKTKRTRNIVEEEQVEEVESGKSRSKRSRKQVEETGETSKKEETKPKKAAAKKTSVLHDKAEQEEEVDKENSTTTSNKKTAVKKTTRAKTAETTAVAKQKTNKRKEVATAKETMTTRKMRSRK